MIPGTTGQCPLQAVAQQPAVGQTGERIIEGECVDAVLCVPQLPDLRVQTLGVIAQRQLVAMQQFAHALLRLCELGNLRDPALHRLRRAEIERTDALARLGKCLERTGDDARLYLGHTACRSQQQKKAAR